ncbi:MAG: helix-turn-helix domain-containing protein [Actinobacteria bacterium]|nr:helix-turn-helix domain-containing protein [Actinomycetota bacterium]
MLCWGAVRSYAAIPSNLHGVAGLTIDEIIRAAWHEVWGPTPGDAGFDDVLLTTVEASALTGLAVNSLGGRIARGTLPARMIGSRYLISEFELAWVGLIAPQLRLQRAAARKALARQATTPPAPPVAFAARAGHPALRRVLQELSGNADAPRGMAGARRASPLAAPASAPTD